MIINLISHIVKKSIVEVIEIILKNTNINDIKPLILRLSLYIIIQI